MTLEEPMLRTILFFTAFWIIMLLSLLFLVPLLILSIPGLGKAKEGYVLAITRFWAKYVLFSGGAKIEVKGLENLPEDKNICIVANHQSYYDIPLIMATIPRIVGFVAKKELRYMPFISTWMKQIGCVFLDRKNPRQALATFDEGAQQIRNGKAKLIFPEGTRSRGGAMGSFKPGALKLAFRADAIIVPVSIDGTYRLLEEKGKINPARATVTIHPPVSAASLNREEQKKTAETVARLLASAIGGSGR
jgi:1-acyl-sn-glycerol-3-phosphate acyltransferase